MYTFAWTITLKWNRKVNLSFDYVENFSSSWDKVIYVFWETNLSSIEDLLENLKDDLWLIKHHDISISKSMKVEILNELFDDWVFEVATFEGEEVNFKEIKDRFLNAPEVIAIREAGFSEVFGNRKIKVDFLY